MKRFLLCQLILLSCQMALGQGVGGNGVPGGFVPQPGAAGPNSTFFDDFYTGANMASDPIGSPTSDSCSPSNTYTDNNHPGNMLLTSGTAGTGTGIVCGLVSELASIASANTSQGWTWDTAVYVAVLPWLDLRAVYGPFAVSVSLMMWAFLTGLLLLAGAQYSATRYTLSLAHQADLERIREEAESRSSSYRGTLMLRSHRPI